CERSAGGAGTARVVKGAGSRRAGPRVSDPVRGRSLPGSLRAGARAPHTHTHLPGRIPVIPGPMNITPSRVLARASVAAHGSLLLVLAACTAPAPTPEADLLILNARVYTLTWGEPAVDGTPAADAPYDPAAGWRPDAEAVAVRDGRILFVGSTAEAERFRGERTRVLDAAGGTLIPGLIDAHVHLANLGESLARVNLVGVQSEAEVVERVAARAAEVPAGEWIVGYGWDEGAWADRYPDHRLLSERVPDHPVYLRGLHGFAGWANRLALERAGITRHTRAPRGGQIRRDRNGEPTG